MAMSGDNVTMCREEQVTGIEWVKAKNVVKHPTMQGQPQTKRSTELRLQGPALQVGTAMIPILQRTRLRLREVKCLRPQSRFTRIGNQTWAAGCRAWAALTPRPGHSRVLVPGTLRALTVSCSSCKAAGRKDPCYQLRRVSEP